MKAFIRLILTTIACLAALATFAVCVDKMTKEKKYIVMNDVTNEIL